jgi:hypothetical protein
MFPRFYILLTAYSKQRSHPRRRPRTTMRFWCLEYPGTRKIEALDYCWYTFLDGT